MKQENKIVFDKYAIFQTGGKQYQAIPGKTIAIEKIKGDAGTGVSFSDVLFRKIGEKKFEFGRPFIDGFAIKASIVKQKMTKKKPT